MGAIKEGHFFYYSTKRGYRYILDNQKKQPPLNRLLENAGHAKWERKRYYSKLWHPWVQRKIASMIWLTGSGGLPLADRRFRKKMCESGVCNMCSTGASETLEHFFMECPAVSEVWDRFRFLRALVAAEASADSVPARIDNIKTPWNILRVSLVWCLWCQKCGHDLRGGNFHIGVALFRAWQLTIQSGMGAWRELQNHISEPKTRRQMEKEAAFIKIWTHKGVFCKSDGRLKWQMAPHHQFLPKDLANLYRSFRGGTVRCDSGTDSSGNLLPSQVEDTLIAALAGNREERDKAEELADVILHQIFHDIARDVELEESREEAIPIGSMSVNQDDDEGAVPIGSRSEDQEEADEDLSSSDFEDDSSSSSLEGILPSDLQSPSELRLQARFWAAIERRSFDS
ncbi:hypothetical protein KC19_VG181100 [Ceratodon purpureus]|uniref:Reverse transcriptase zinc-binding domain-containing protein n=1 Tax=Ceratodon purpureus TaxID=3225 RepID=A0A8T0HRS3_CERPU|nr:hypothetical protein KC19_VG181100 [Ceratodon purpureus]